MPFKKTIWRLHCEIYSYCNDKYTPDLFHITILLKTAKWLFDRIRSNSQGLFDHASSRIMQGGFQTICPDIQKRVQISKIIQIHTTEMDELVVRREFTDLEKSLVAVVNCENRNFVKFVGLTVWQKKTQISKGAPQVIQHQCIHQIFVFNVVFKTDNNVSWVFESDMQISRICLQAWGWTWRTYANIIL